MFHRYSIGFRSGEQIGQSLASVPSSSRNCLHTLSTWGWALSCRTGITRDPLHQHKVWQSLWGFHPSTWQQSGYCRLWHGGVTLQQYASSDHHWNTTKPVLLDDITGSTMFTTAPPHSFTPVTCALICEHNRAEMADLPILVFSHKCLRFSGSSRTKEQMPVLLLGCCLSTVLSSPRCITDSLLLNAVETVLEDTANVLVATSMDVPSWKSWTTCATWSEGITLCYQ